GPGELYGGELGRSVVAHQDATGGRLTMSDLRAYRPIWRRPLRTRYRDVELATNPPPSSGGILIAFMLGVLEPVTAGMRPGEAPTLRALAEAMRAAGRRRDKHFARLLHRGGLPGHLLSPESLSVGAGEVETSLRGVPSEAPALTSDRGTTHISVVDGAG